MHVNWTLVISCITAFGAIILNYYLERRPRLISYIGHIAFFPMKEPISIITTHSVIIKNVGRKSAMNIRVGHGTLPETRLVIPQTQYTLEGLPEIGGIEMVFPVLQPKAEITISYLYVTPITYDQAVPLYVKSDEGTARALHAIPTPQPAKWVLRIYQLLALIGLATIIYFILKAIQIIYYIIVSIPS